MKKQVSSELWSIDYDCVVSSTGRLIEWWVVERGIGKRFVCYDEKDAEWLRDVLMEKGEK